jgi:poly-gamma-glutamate capsule biosynthesis protein CapA/YwtB (metallophosphatase superfamily)
MLITADIKLLNVKDPHKPFARIQKTLQAEDVVYGNLEGALYDKIDPYEYFSKVRWKHPGTEGAEALKLGNFSALGLANNVIVGGDAIAGTIGILDKMGIAHTGAGMNLAEACAPAIVERNGVKYGFLQRTSIFWPYHHRAVPEGPYRMPPRKYAHGTYQEGESLTFFGAPGVATLKGRTAYEPSYSSIYEAGGAAIIHTWPDEDDLRMLVEDIKKLRPLVDILVVSNHWRITTGPGDSSGLLARDFRVEAAHASIDAGADIVAGHGTHYVDEIEVYKGKAIFYGLGELYYGWDAGATTPERPRVSKVKLIVDVEVRNKAIQAVSARPIISGGWPIGNGAMDECEFRKPSDEPDAMARLAQISEKFGTRLKMGPDSIGVIY